MSLHTCRVTWRFTARDFPITAVFASRTFPTWPASSSTRRFITTCKSSPVVSKTLRCHRIWIGILDLTNNWDSQVFPKWIQSLAKCTMASLTKKISKRVVRHSIKKRTMFVSTAGVHIGMPDPCLTTRTATKLAPFSAQCAKRNSPT